MKIHTEGLPGDTEHSRETLIHLLSIPHKIVCHHDVNGLAQIVLHELGHNNSFGLDKAGYLINNPDFDCLRGIAGYSPDECRHHKQDIWQSPHSFADDMKDAQYHQQLASFSHKSLPRNGEEDVIDQDVLTKLASVLGFKNPSCCVWPMKHGNYGLLLFEVNNATRHAHHRDLLHNCAALLSLC